VVILCGVALVRTGGGQRPAEAPRPRSFVRGLTGFWQSSSVPKNFKAEK
jgi:hypothetical protein